MMKSSVSLLVLAVFLGCQKKEPAPESVPDCIQQVIARIQQEPIWEPPAKIYQYVYQGQTAYYIPARCCDIPSQLIVNCDTVCAPDGGFSGKGDGRCPDFAKEARNPVLVWEDTRKK